MGAPYVVDGYLVDGGYVYQPVVTGMTTNWLFQWDNTAALSWQDALAASRTWQGAWDVGNFTLDADETLTVAEALSNKPAIALAEAFAFAEARASYVQSAQVESFAIAEANAKSYSQYQNESFAFAEAPSNTVGKNSSEAFAIAEARTSSIGLNPSEAFVVAETYLNSVGFVREFNETLVMADALANTYGLNKAEAFAVVDAWRRQGDLVISDMMISSGADLTMAEFQDFLLYGNVPGYEKWRDFIPGDYEYREAMFRVVLQSKNADRGLLTNLQATVDVPDMIDRGSATITVAANGAAVTYNRIFHIVPEITLASRGGSGSNPIAPEFYGSPTKTGFTVRLRDTVTGAYVTGSFTWAAHGY
jgi:hypothetical protein